MSAIIVTFANLGRKQNLRTTDMLPVVEKLAASGDLVQIICQINSGYSFPYTIGAVPNSVRYPIRIFEKITGISLSHEMQDRLFDFFAARRLKRVDVTFIHGAFSMPRTVRRARKIGSVVVDISVSAYVGSNAELERTELNLLGYPGYASTYLRLMEEMTPLEQIDYLILMSDYARKTYLDAGYPADRMFMAHIDIDTKRFSPDRSHRHIPFRFLYLAFTQPLKGLHYLLDAWESLGLPSAELLVIGDFHAMPKELMERYRERMRKDASISWQPGTLKPEEEYRRAAVYVFPTLTEGFGRSAMEAMACGIPVITTENARGIVEDGKTGFVVPIRDAEALKEKLAYLYHHQNEAEEMGREARRAVEKKKPFGDAVFEIYQDILKRERQVRSLV